jgi:hypothetical protein
MDQEHELGPIFGLNISKVHHITEEHLIIFENSWRDFLHRLQNPSLVGEQGLVVDLPDDVFGFGAECL